MFVDASAMVAVLRGEAESHDLAQQMRSANRRITTPLAIWETAMGIRKESTLSVDDARETVESFLAYTNVSVVAITPDHANLALEAFDRYGKRRHPAALNMADCFAYACAKVHRVPLLYVGNDFAQTDVNEGF